ncbi:S-adenosyl-L-methionine-dependent methyltransferase [Mycena floridula]|nr:S-adenosyl-L-methionine-dependent methyltransferase [Mycena floridula]
MPRHPEMTSRPNRPTAFSVSFPGESQVGNKRLRESSPIQDSPSKQVHLDHNVCYRAPHGMTQEIYESKNLVIPGEHDYEDNGKPVRLLSQFSIFETRTKMLTLLDASGPKSAAGRVTPFMDNEEDEDGLQFPCVKLEIESVILQAVEGELFGDPLIILETEFARYVLEKPAAQYKRYFTKFKDALVIVHCTLRAAAETAEKGNFRTLFRSIRGLAGTAIDEATIKRCLTPSAVQSMLSGFDASTESKIKRNPWIREILREEPKFLVGKVVSSWSNGWLKGITGLNLDNALLKPEAQISTHVTELIGSIAHKYFRKLQVVSAMPLPSKVDYRKEKSYDDLLVLLLRRAGHKPGRHGNSDFDKKDRLKHGSRYLKTVRVNYANGDFESFSVGDVVLIPRDDLDLSQKVRRIEQAFWVAEIIYIDIELDGAHIRWFEHGMHTVLSELADASEVFQTSQCQRVPLSSLKGKIILSSEPGSCHYFCKFEYDAASATFRSLKPKEMLQSHGLGECITCPHTLQKKETKYHRYDFVLYAANDKGPGQLGHIIKLQVPRGHTAREATSSTLVTVKRLGRLQDVKGLPVTEVRDERNVFLTDDTVEIQISDIISKVYILAKASILRLNDWIQEPDHFYLQFCFPSMNAQWKQHRDLAANEIVLCGTCVEGRLRYNRELSKFVRAEKKPLKCLDLFGGTGAFALGLAEGSQMIKVTHAVEIAPSAARTYRKNSKGTVVYNCCVNTFLSFSVKHHLGMEVKRPVDCHGKELPDPPSPGEIDVISVGFPCQSYSSLNVSRKDNDKRGELVLTALAVIDHLKPKFCFFENVKGFLEYKLSAGGEVYIHLGGPKLLLRSLLAMGYQSRLALLQAGHYGSPQTRIRVFVVAAQNGLDLPEFPQPSHDFPLHQKLQISLATGPIQPIRTRRGITFHPTVTIQDAIGDLPPFHWRIAKQANDKEENIPSFVCDKSSPRSGYEGPVRYLHPARTSYQLWARRDTSPTVLQHFTRSFHEAKVERVIAIPTKPGADYRSLPEHLKEFQISNPTSAVGRNNFPPGLYGRLDKKSYFNTTVGNVDPTAKQCWIIHPTCKRILTVRELARSQGFPDDFIFETQNNDVVTIHRQIGNAVAWPVSIALGRQLKHSVFRQWREAQKDRIVVDSD